MSKTQSHEEYIARVVKFKLDDLPDENFYSIFQFVEMKRLLLNCAMVSRRWFRIVSDSDLHVSISKDSKRAHKFLYTALNNPTITKLKSLKLSGNHLKTEHLEMILYSGSFIATLTDLDLSYNHMACEYIVRIMRKVLKNLQSLNLRYTGIGYDRRISTLQSLFCEKESRIRKLTCLDLSYENIGPEGAEMISCNSLLINLKTLKLRGCFIELLGTQHICKKLDQLTCLDLSLNMISDEGCSIVSTSPTMKNLTMLDISNNNIGPKGVSVMCESSTLSNLTSLNVSENCISYAFQSIVKNQHFNNLTSLDVSSCHLGYIGFIRSNNTYMTNLTYLNLDNNSLGNDQIHSICNCNTLSNLRELNLSRNNLSYRGIYEISSTTNLSKLTTLKIDGNSIDYLCVYSILNSNTFSNPLQLLEKNKLKTIRSIVDSKKKQVK